MKAYCWAKGLIQFGRRVPEGALPIAEGPAKPLREFIEVKARHGYSTKKIKGRLTKIPGSDCLLVPGVPEADDQMEAIDNLGKWCDWIRPHAPNGVIVR